MLSEYPDTCAQNVNPIIMLPDPVRSRFPMHFQQKDMDGIPPNFPPGFNDTQRVMNRLQETIQTGIRCASPTKVSSLQELYCTLNFLALGRAELRCAIIRCQIDRPLPGFVWSFAHLPVTRHLIPIPFLCDRIKENTRKHMWKGMNIIHGTSNHTSGLPSVSG